MSSGKDSDFIQGVAGTFAVVGALVGAAEELGGSPATGFFAGAFVGGIAGAAVGAIVSVAVRLLLMGIGILMVVNRFVGIAQFFS